MPTPNRVQPIRSNVTGQRNVTGRLPGELYTNWADRQIGVVSPTTTALDLVGVRYFSTSANYAIGDYVVQGGLLYRAIATVTAGAFNPAQWTSVATQSDINAAVGNYLPITGGVLTGALGVDIALPSGIGPNALLANIVTAGNYAMNAYFGSGVWRAQITGASGIVAYDTAGGSLNFYSSPSVAAGAPIANALGMSLNTAGRLTVTQDVWASGNAVARGATYFSYNNATDFYALADSTDRILYWATNWYNYWHNADGSWHWTYGPSGDRMSIDGSGNFWALGQIYSNTNVIANGAMWCNGNITTGNTVQGGYLHSTGSMQSDLDTTVGRNLQVNGAATVNGNATVSGTITAGNFSSNLDVSAARNLGVSGSAWVTGNLTVSGTFSVGTFSVAQLSVTNYITFPNWYGHAIAYGWDGNGFRWKMDGSDKKFLTQSPNVYTWSNNTYGTCAGTSDNLGTFAWNVYGALTMEEATQKAQDAQNDIATIKTLRMTVEALVERVAALEARLGAM